MSRDKVDPEVLVQDLFTELRTLYNDGHVKLIEDEVCYMTGKKLHTEGGEECLLAARDADAYVFEPTADVISEHLRHGGEITDVAAEAIVRRLANAPGVVETAHFDSWLRVFGFESLRRRGG